MPEERRERERRGVGEEERKGQDRRGEGRAE